MFGVKPRCPCPGELCLCGAVRLPARPVLSGVYALLPHPLRGPRVRAAGAAALERQEKPRPPGHWPVPAARRLLCWPQEPPDPVPRPSPAHAVGVHAPVTAEAGGPGRGGGGAGGLIPADWSQWEGDVRKWSLQPDT